MGKAPEKLQRPTVEALDAILGMPVPVLDDGFVRVVDYMGSDAAIVQAARVSYGEGTKKVREDRGLIRYLMRHYHTSPFEMCEIKLHVRVPMDCWRQWIRHRTASVNEYSTRYSVAIDAAQTTAADGWRKQGVANRQGSEGAIDTDAGSRLSAREGELQALAREVYDERLRAGVAREQARKDLPLSTYTEAYWKIDLNNLLRFLRLRMDEHAQLEIRLYAKAIGEQIVSKWVPFVWEAFNDYWRDALSLSDLESRIVSALASGDADGAVKIVEQAGLLDPKKQSVERAEIEGKLKSLGLVIPWDA